MLYGRISKGVQMIRFLCPYCREKNNVADNLEGKQSTCTACSRNIPVPFRDDFSSVLPDEAVAKSNFDQTLDKHPRMKFYRFMQSFLDVSFDELSIFIMSSSFLLLFVLAKCSGGIFISCFDTFIEKSPPAVLTEKLPPIQLYW